MSIYRDAADRIDAGVRFALAVVVHSTGSTPQKAGAKALFEAGGAVIGTLGGGCLEAECRQRALRAMDDGEALLFDIKLDEVTGWDDGLICGGKVRVFIDPNTTQHKDAYRAAAETIAQQHRGALVTWLKHDTVRAGTIEWHDAVAPNSAHGLNGEIDTAVTKRKPCTVTTDAGEAFIEPVAPEPHLIIAGAGHIGKAVCGFAAASGFRVTVIDDRAVFANSDNLPEAGEVICGGIAEAIEKQDIGPETYVLIVTRGHRHDGAVLAACVNRPAAYIGMIGSRRKGAMIRKSIVEEGIAAQDAVDRVVSPVGLDIGAQSVPEIALSIAAQLVAMKNTRSLHAEPLNFVP